MFYSIFLFETSVDSIYGDVYSNKAVRFLDRNKLKELILQMLIYQI